MSAPQNTEESPSFTDRLGQRLRWAVLASLLINIVIWRGAAAIAHHAIHVVPRPVEITRIILHKDGHKTPKVVTKKQIQKKIQHIRKIVRRPPPPRPRKVVVVRRPRPVPAPRPRTPRPQAHRPPPQGAHHKVIAALPGKGPSTSKEPDVLAGGNARQGEAIEQENPGNAVVNPSQPVEQKPVPPAPPPPPPPPPPPVKVAQAPPAPAPEPEPAPAPRPSGPTRDAEPTDQVKPEIPDELKQGEYKSFVRVKVQIDADGNATPILRTSSGNPEIDRRVLEALKRWRWKPALRDGEPVSSTLLFKFEFEVQ